MPKSTAGNLDVDLQGGVVPISKAASALAALIKRGKERQQPIIVTQKGYPTGVLLPIDLYSTLRSIAQREVEAATDASGIVHGPAAAAAALNDVPNVAHAVAALPELAEDVALEELAGRSEPAEASTPRRGRGGRRAKSAS